MIDITELTSVQKNANIHRLSRLIAYAPNDELRQMAVEVEQYTDQLIEALEKAQQRIVELEDAEQKLCAANVTLDARAELAERQLAEMVSRTITVKMPKLKMLEDYLAEVAVEERKAILLGVRMELHRALNAEGIKWEAE